MMARKAPRPAYSVLGHARDDAIELPPWQESLRRYLDDRELSRSMKLLVTGGAGFIGSTYVRRHLAREPRRRDRRPRQAHLRRPAREPGDGADPSGSTFVEGDIADREAVAGAIDGCDAVVNFAAESHVDRSIEDPGAFIQTDVYGTYVLLEAARDAGIRHLQISTDEVYGSIEEGSFTESSPIEPSSPYSASKAGGDLIVRAFHHTYGADCADRPRLEQLRALPAPREADPADGPQRDGRRPAARLRRRHAGPQLALHRGLRRRDRRRPRARRGRARSTTSAAPRSCRTSRSSRGSSSSPAATSR